MSDVYHACLYDAQGKIKCSYKKKIPITKTKPNSTTSLNIDSVIRSNDIEVKILDSELLQNW